MTCLLQHHHQSNLHHLVPQQVGGKCLFLLGRQGWLALRRQERQEELCPCGTWSRRRQVWRAVLSPILGNLSLVFLQQELAEYSPKLNLCCCVEWRVQWLPRGLSRVLSPATLQQVPPLWGSSSEASSQIYARLLLLYYSLKGAVCYLPHKVISFCRKEKE